MLYEVITAAVQAHLPLDAELDLLAVHEDHLDPGVGLQLAHLVITSYSIHYTKLYEAPPTLRARTSATSPGVWWT